jgi:hypothetical protein
MASWRYGLFACYCDKSCLLGSFLPCIAFGSTQERMRKIALGQQNDEISSCNLPVRILFQGLHDTYSFSAVHGVFYFHADYSSACNALKEIRSRKGAAWRKITVRIAWYHCVAPHAAWCNNIERFGTSRMWKWNNPGHPHQ